MACVYGASPSWDRLFEIAAGREGYITNKQAAEAGYSLPLIQFHIGRGRLQRVRRGILRLVHYPAGEHEELVPTWLWSEQKGVFSHTTALMLQDLSDALPAKQYLTVPQAWRKRRMRLPRGVILRFADIQQTEVTWLGPVPITKPLRTIMDCVVDHVVDDLIRQATEQGVHRRLFGRAEVNAAIRRARKERDAAVELSVAATVERTSSARTQRAKRLQ